MSKRGKTGDKSKTEDDGASGPPAEPSIDCAELENLLKTFNNDGVKSEICKKIKELEALIVETELDSGASSPDQNDDNDARKTQKITLPISGQVIQASGNSLKSACELIEAWSKSNRQAHASSMLIDEHPTT